MNAKDYTKLAEKHWEEKNADGAIANYSEVIKLEPNNSSAYLYRGMAYGIKEQFDLALADFTETIRIEPNLSGIPYYQRGVIYILKGDSARAISDIEMAVKLAPNNAEWQKVLNEVKASAGKSGSDSHEWNSPIGNFIVDLPIVGFISVVICGILVMISEKLPIINVPFIGAIIGFVVGSFGGIIITIIGGASGSAAVRIIGVLLILVFGISGSIMGFTGGHKQRK